jgi:hypothetical protein
MKFITANGEVVHVDEKTLSKLKAHPDVLEFLPETFSKFKVSERSGLIKESINLGRIIGKSGLVDTPEIELNTKTQFAYRTERKYPSHISTMGEGKSCETVAISIKKVENTWELATAFIGVNSPSEPFYYFDKESRFYKDENQLHISLDFWMKHALMYEEGVTGDVYESTWAEELERISNLA